MTVFTNHARGPMFEKYSKQLIEECAQHFENGRQLCEQPSLTGNPCTLPKHDKYVLSYILFIFSVTP